MNAQAQFEKVAAICDHLKEERGEGGEYTAAEVVTVTTAYLLACDRTNRTHHLEESPRWVFGATALSDEQGRAWGALWSIIGEANTRTNSARYTAAWDVWGVLLPQYEGAPSMGDRD